MATPTYDSLLEHVQRQEIAVKEAELHMRKAQHDRTQAAARVSKREAELRALHLLAMGALHATKSSLLYDQLCHALVRELHWDAAIVLRVGEVAQVEGSFHLTQRQLRAVGEHLMHLPRFLKAYAHHETISTIGKDDTTALGLRTVFHTDEVVGAPIMFGGHLFGYVLACAHTTRNRTRTQDDALILTSLSSLTAQAVENIRTLQNLEVQNEKLRHLDELKDSFLSITSHQLRTPLSIVKWILSILDTDEAIKKLPEQHKLIDQAYVSNERLIHVVNDLLTASRVQEGKLPFSPQLTDLTVIVQDVVTGMHKLCEAAQVSLMAEYVPSLPELNLDPILLKEAIQNLLNNALDYNKVGGTIRVELATAPGVVTLAVINTGVGVKKTDMETIFGQFYRSPEAVRLHPNGNGLGLYLARAIVEQHHGKITCESVPNEQTTFTITLPTYGA